MPQVPMTKQGETKLREELDYLKTIERPRIIQAIAEARAHGDLKENAEYHAARDEQGFTEGRIQEINAKLGDARVIDVTEIAHTGNVIFGVTVDLINCETEDALRYQIVGDDEANVKQGKISISSPVARALIGKEEGDVVVVRTPAGEVEYEIDQVRHI